MTTKQIAFSISTYVRYSMNSQRKEAFLESLLGPKHLAIRAITDVFHILCRAHRLKTGKEMVGRYSPTLFEDLYSAVILELQDEIWNLPIAFAA
jgi:hypothetical protein